MMVGYKKSQGTNYIYVFKESNMGVSQVVLVVKNQPKK